MKTKLVFFSLAPTYRNLSPLLCTIRHHHLWPPSPSPISSSWFGHSLIPRHFSSKDSPITTPNLQFSVAQPPQAHQQSIHHHHHKHYQVSYLQSNHHRSFIIATVPDLGTQDSALLSPSSINHAVVVPCSAQPSRDHGVTIASLLPSIMLPPRPKQEENRRRKGERG